MNEKCNICGGEMIEGIIVSGVGVACFYPEDEEKKLKPKRSTVKAYCCKECGNICLTAAELQNLR